ncbi:MAG: translation elongation factor Ts [Chlorobi bacterium]|nr:translation elongation factor Ts [Chlorobiota bacterium]MCI0716724.1 translation elongation factor Ts [Chlorobiota bacterium]
MEISLDLVKKLREKTGAGISDCKKALTESNGDFEKAIEFLRKKGAATSQKRSDRIAKEGLILAKASADKNEAAIVEVNCETDFVARSDTFQKLAATVLESVFTVKSPEVNVILNSKANSGNTIQQLLDETTASVGEKVEIKRTEYFKSNSGFFCEYNHVGNKVASIIEIEGKLTDEGITLGNDLAMQVVAMKPLTIDRNGISKEMIEKEKEIYRVQAINEGKAENIADRIASNKVEKFYEENCLLEQEFVKEQGKTVSDIIKFVNSVSGGEYKVKTMVRYQLGETIM